MERKGKGGSLLNVGPVATGRERIGPSRLIGSVPCSCLTEQAMNRSPGPIRVIRGLVAYQFFLQPLDPLLVSVRELRRVVTPRLRSN